MSDEQKVEAPVIEAPIVPEVKAPEIDKDALLSELTKMGVKNADELVNMQRASSQAGQLANLLGEVRRENAEMKRMLQDVSKTKQDPYGEPQSNSIDLRQVMREVVSEVVDTKLSTAQQRQVEAMRAQRAEMAKIQGNRWYPAVKDVWDKYINHPSTQDRLLAGESSLTDEFRNVVDTYTMKMLDAQTNALQSTRSVVAPPHVESGNSQSIQNPPRTEESQARKRQIVDNRAKGSMSSDAALEALIGQMLPADDPLWRTR